VIVRFVDIVGLVDHHCLPFLFIMYRILLLETEHIGGYLRYRYSVTASPWDDKNRKTCNG